MQTAPLFQNEPQPILQAAGLSKSESLPQIAHLSMDLITLNLLVSIEITRLLTLSLQSSALTNIPPPVRLATRSNLGNTRTSKSYIRGHSPHFHLRTRIHFWESINISLPKNLGFSSTMASRAESSVIVGLGSCQQNIGPLSHSPAIFNRTV